MGKNDLIGGSLWEHYSKKVADRMNNPLFRGEITEAQAAEMNARLIVANWGAEACGDAVQLFWAVDPDTHIIKDARFKSFGCGTAIASSDIMAELCIGKTVDETITITNIDVEKALRDTDDIPAIPPQKMHCSVMAYDVIKLAAALYKGVDVSTMEKEHIVCECARVSLQTIKDAIRINNLTTVEEITQYTKAGAYCKSCIRPGGHEKKDIYLIDILEQTRSEMEKEKAAYQPAEKSFNEMTAVQQARICEKILDAHVRPVLAKDGGSVEITDIAHVNDHCTVYISYAGTCKGCVSSTTTTLSMIENILQKEIDPLIKVVPM